MQNTDGGFASYEIRRGPAMLELLNPAEVFEDIMVEHSYPECSCAVLKSFVRFQRYIPSHRPSDVQTAIYRARDFILDSQLADGSWYGSWAVCYTYAIWYALEALALVGETWHTCERVREACRWLLERQMEDGGWGEHHTSCELNEYVAHKTSQVVNTGWAVLALMHAGYPDKTPIERGLKVSISFKPLHLQDRPLTCLPQLIMSRQQPNGEWLQEGIEGVFNRTWYVQMFTTDLLTQI